MEILNLALRPGSRVEEMKNQIHGDSNQRSLNLNLLALGPHTEELRPVRSEPTVGLKNGGRRG